MSLNQLIFFYKKNHCFIKLLLRKCSWLFKSNSDCWSQSFARAQLIRWLMVCVLDRKIVKAFTVKTGGWHSFSLQCMSWVPKGQVKLEFNEFMYYYKFLRKDITVQEYANLGVLRLGAMYWYEYWLKLVGLSKSCNVSLRFIIESTLLQYIELIW